MTDSMVDARELSDDEPLVSPSDPKGWENASAVKRFRPRFTLLTLMLLASCVCVWAFYFRLRIRTAELVQQNKAMRAYSRSLVLDDPNRISIARQWPEWYDESIWQIYIPKDQTYVMHLATRDIVDFNPSPAVENFPEPVASKSLNAGTHRVEIRQSDSDEGSLVEVFVDETVVISQLETEPNWDPGEGSSGGAQFDAPQQPEKTDRVVLFQRKFLHMTPRGTFQAPREPASGVQLWLERAE